MIRDIVLLGDPRLKQVSADVTSVDAELLKLVSDMLDTMVAAHGIGLAAPQVGINVNLFVADVPEQTEVPLVCINPQIVATSAEKKLTEEGCLSIPGVRHMVSRPKKVSIEYLDETGHPRRLDAEGLLATCIQHEIDHLKGVLFLDRVPAAAHRELNDKLEEKDLPRYFEKSKKR